MKTAYIFTGQGFQFNGMLHSLPSTLTTRHRLEEASDLLKEDVLLLDSKESLSSNRSVQLSIYISEVILGELAMVQKPPEYVLGHSIGAFSAATASGCLPFMEGIKLVELRGRLMEQMYPWGFGMLSVAGLSLEVMERELDRYKNKEERLIYIANINSQTQIVLTGSNKELQGIQEYLQQNYLVRTKCLKVKVPSHCSCMNEVTYRLEQAFDTIELLNIRIPYIMNTTGRRTRQKDMIKKDLIQGVSHPVLWYDSIELLYELEVRCFKEISQGNTLTKIGEEIAPDCIWNKLL